MFTIPITPKMRERPRAIKAIMRPQIRPLMRRKRTVDTISGNVMYLYNSSLPLHLLCPWPSCAMARLGLLEG